MRKVLFTETLIIVIFINILALPLFSAEPPELPGEEITDQQYMEFILPSKEVKKKVPTNSPHSITWIDSVTKTWDAPSMAIQIAQDKEPLLMGLGAIFIPTYTTPYFEPEVLIYNSVGQVVGEGESGRKYNVPPGRYQVVFGSGNGANRIVRDINVKEGELKPIIPTWCGLIIDVVNDDNIPIRGEYEMLSLKTFELLGRGHGRNPDLDEDLDTWIVEPGTYKIFGLGENYSTNKNYITVRLLPGELTRISLVMDDDGKIIGGGTVQNNFTKTERQSPWEYRFNISGGVDFTYEKDDGNDTKPEERNNETDISLKFMTELNYQRGKYNWKNRLIVDEGVMLIAREDEDLRLSSSVDDIQISSVLSWNLLSWVGPYSRLEFRTGIIPEVTKIEQEDNPNTYFVILDRNDETSVLTFNRFINDDNLLSEPAFSPYTISSGIGTKVNYFKSRYIEGSLFTGINITYEKIWGGYRESSENLSVIDTLSLSPDDKILIQKLNTDSLNYTYKIMEINQKSRVDIGPELLLNNKFHLGSIATINSEFYMMLPFKRFKKPDINWDIQVSWHLIRMVSLDYTFGYDLVQAEDVGLQQDKKSHRVRVRFSF